MCEGTETLLKNVSMGEGWVRPSSLCDAIRRDQVRPPWRPDTDDAHGSRALAHGGLGVKKCEVPLQAHRAEGRSGDRRGGGGRGEGEDLDRANRTGNVRAALSVELFLFPARHRHFHLHFLHVHILHGAPLRRRASCLEATEEADEGRSTPAGSVDSHTVTQSSNMEPPQLVSEDYQHALLMVCAALYNTHTRHTLTLFK